MEQTKGALRLKAPKNGKPRTITLPAFAVEELRRLKREQAEELLQQNLGIMNPDHPTACCPECGAEFRLYRAWQRFCSEACKNRHHARARTDLLRRAKLMLTPAATLASS